MYVAVNDYLPNVSTPLGVFPVRVNVTMGTFKKKKIKKDIRYSD